MKAIQLCFTLSIFIFSTLWLSGQKTLTQANMSQKPDTDCLRTATTFWNNVLETNCNNRKDCQLAIDKAWKKHKINNTSAKRKQCSSSSCADARLELKDFVVKQRWNNKADLAQILCLAQKKFAKKYPSCIEMSKTICDFQKEQKSNAAACAEMTTNYWTYVMSRDFRTGKELDQVLKDATKKTMKPTSRSGCFSEECSRARLQLEKYVKKQKWESKREFSKVVSNGIKKYSSTYPNCISVKALACCPDAVDE